MATSLDLHQLDRHDRKSPRRRNGPDPVDIHVGARVRLRRTALGISLTDLAATLGITFQQMYKYEKARNRISAGRLYGLSKALDVPVTFFFDGLIGTDAPVGRKRKDPR